MKMEVNLKELETNLEKLDFLDENGGQFGRIKGQLVGIGGQFERTRGQFGEIGHFGRKWRSIW